jgi:CDP-glucose 4,6-dehydratase
VRPWQHVLEPLYGYLRLAETLWLTPHLAGAYNFGPESSQAATVREVVEQARAAYGCGDAVYRDDSDGPHEAGRLALETAKARLVLNVQPRWPLTKAIQRTLTWYRRQHNGADVRALCAQEISDYEVWLRAS